MGTAGSINAVANFITQLKHSGYFDQVEIKESAQDDQERGRADVQLHADGPVRPAAVQPATRPDARASQRRRERARGKSMAISFKESPWYIQALVFVALAILLLAAGEYVPGSPVASARAASCRRCTNRTPI